MCADVNTQAGSLRRGLALRPLKDTRRSTPSLLQLSLHLRSEAEA
jgi:hypothetical protein